MKKTNCLIQGAKIQAVWSKNILRPLLVLYNSGASINDSDRAARVAQHDLRHHMDHVTY